jgi:surface carbohydrate biosynthesis protein (TIGR04326 family)
MTIWDYSDTPPSDNADIVYVWNGYAETDSVYSLLRYVELHAERLRWKYLAWIHDLGESRFDGKCLIDHLVLDDGLSYWWMTLFVEKSPWKSPSITDAIRLFALEEIVIKQRPGKLKLVSANRSLHEVTVDLCQSLKIEYEWEKLPSGPGRLSLKVIYRSLPQPVQAILGFTRYLFIRWPLRKASKTDWFQGPKSLLFCSYFIHLDPDLCANGQFYSRQWEVLPKLLHDNGFRINWIQHYLESSVVPDTGVALNWVQQFNQNRQEQGFHTFLDTFLSWRIVWRVLKKWLMLGWIARRLKNVQMAFHPQGSKLSFWPIMRMDWQISMHGIIALGNLLWMELFDTALQNLPHQEKGLYLCENQGWERAFIHSWRKHEHGELIAVAHSTVRFWDLRYFTDPRSLLAHVLQAMPQPDCIAVNGPMAWRTLAGYGYPIQRLVAVEALRYLNLAAVVEKQKQNLSRKSNPRQQVLVLGDIMPYPTHQVLWTLESLPENLRESVEIAVKPHPGNMVLTEDYPGLNMELITEPLYKILHRFDIAYGTNSTSANLDAYMAGLKVIVHLDESGLNLSPLRGMADVHFVNNARELAAAMKASVSNDTCEREIYFWLDAGLPRWQKIFGLNFRDCRF